MPDNILTKKTDYVNKLSLVTLKNNLGMLRSVYTKPFPSVGIGLRKGKHFHELLPFRTVTSPGPLINEEPLVDTSVKVTINIDRNVAFSMDLLDKATDIDNFYNDYLMEGVVQMAHDATLIASDEMRLCPNWIGTPGTSPNSDVLTDASAMMTSLAVPSKRFACLEPFTCAAISKQAKELQMDTITKEAWAKGYKGRVAGYEVMETANIGTQKTGDRGAAGSITYASHTTNANGTSCVMTLGAPLTGDLYAGENFSIQGLNTVNPRTRRTIGKHAQFSLATDAKAGDTKLNLSTDINDGTSKMTGEDGIDVSLKAYQNVASAPVAGAPLMFAGASNQEYAVSLLYHRDALGFYPGDFGASDGINKRVVKDKSTNLTMMMMTFVNIDNRREKSRIDLVAATKLRYPQLAWKMYG